MRILVIDGEENARVYLPALLERRGSAIVSATNGQEGYEAARASPPKPIVSDLMMPKMAGSGLCRCVKSDETLSSVLFVFYSANLHGARGSAACDGTQCVSFYR